MTANTTPITFRRGGNAAEEAEKAEKAAIDAKKRDKNPDYFSIQWHEDAKDADQNTKVIRLITDHDDWIWVDQHNFVPTKEAPKGTENWPQSMTAICRRDKVFAGHYDDCYICDKKIQNRFGKVAYARIRIWALAVERELVRGDGTEELGGESKKGVVIGVRDKVDEIEELTADGKPTGTTLRYPRIVIVNQPMKGFFGGIKSLYGLFGTVIDRDLVITRDGGGKDTNYRITALDPIDDVKPGTPYWENLQQSVAEREINLDAIVARLASDEYYARFFNPAYEVDKDGNVVPTGTTAPTSGLANVSSAAAPAPGESYSPDLRARLHNLGKPQGS